jgi:ribosomal protein S18 acetylase RimI-like enzyme
MNVTIRPERPDTEVSKELIAELDALLNPNYPPESRHGYSAEKLIQQKVAFFVIYADGVPAGCGGVQIFPDYAELKRMYVRPRFRGLGLGKRMVTHLSEYAAERGVKVLRLETGVSQLEAISLYESFGFRRIPPFGDYFEDPLSLCMEKRIG